MRKIENIDLEFGDDIDRNYLFRNWLIMIAPDFGKGIPPEFEFYG